MPPLKTFWKKIKMEVVRLNPSPYFGVKDISNMEKLQTIFINLVISFIYQASL